MSVLSKGSTKKFLINTSCLLEIIKDTTSYTNYESKLNTLESKLLAELYENEDFKTNFDKTVINIVEIIENENEKLKGFINGENCHCTSITITVLDDGIDILFNENFDNTIKKVGPRIETNTLITIVNTDAEGNNVIYLNFNIIKKY